MSCFVIVSIGGANQGFPPFYEHAVRGLYDDPRFTRNLAGENPTIDGTVVERNAALVDHLLQIPIAELITQIPTDCLHNQPCLEMPALEVIRRLALQLLGNGIHNHRRARQLSERKCLLPWSTSG